MENTQNQTKLQESRVKDPLLCQSTAGNVKAVYLTYAIVTAVVLAFQAVVFYCRIFNVFHIAITVAFLASIIYGVLKTGRDSKDWIKLYENHFEMKNGVFTYDQIKDYHTSAGQLTVRVEKSVTLYVSNAEELSGIIRTQRSKTRKK